MKTKKCKVYVYDCKKHKGEIVEKDLPVYEELKPVESHHDIALKNVAECVIEINEALKNMSNEASAATNINQLKSAITSSIQILESKISKQIDILHKFITWYNNTYRTQTKSENIERVEKLGKGEEKIL